MLAVGGLFKSYGSTPALRGVDLEVAAGETCCLIGPNGAGKTTLVSIVSGLLRPDAGTALVGGVDVQSDPFRARSLMGIAPQELGIYPLVTVRQNLSLFAELYGLRGADLRRRVDAVAGALALAELMDRPARELSGGEKRRVHTAMAMVHSPPLLILDEPTSGVDIATRARLLESVRELAREHGTAVCYSTHYLPEVEQLDGSVAIIDQGRIIARGAVAELISALSQSAVELHFDGPAPDIVLAGHKVEVAGSTVRVYTDDPAVDTAAVLAGLGADAAHLRAVEVVSSGLESVFLSLTGRRYRAEGAGQPDPIEPRAAASAAEEEERMPDVVAP